MALVACLADTPVLAKQIRTKAEELGHEVESLCASCLDRATRQWLRALNPDVIVLELSRALDNLHFYFFLRSDSELRHTPVILAANGRNLSEQATMLEADGYLNGPFDLGSLGGYLERDLALEEAVAA
jgi:CheY-like chemotaxis protein